MEIGKINAAIEQAGYNPFGVSGTGEQDAMKLAEKNGISIQKAQEILKEAEQTTKENAQMQAQQAAMLEMLNTQDEEEMIVLDDVDFDNFLNQQSPEQQMQNTMNQFQFGSMSSMQNNNQNAQNFFAQNDNPFLRMRN